MFEFHEKGCIAANSLYLTTGIKMNKKTSNIDRYKNFGLREEWLNDYLNNLDAYWMSNHGLNENYQIPSLKAWLRDAEIIDENNNATELAKLLSNQEIMVNYPNLIWEIVWINLSYNSFIVNWYTKNISIDTNCSQKGLEGMIKEQYGAYKEKTVHNAVYQLRRTLKESPIGSVLRQYEEISKDTFKRETYKDISCEALAYSLYKYAVSRKIFSLRIFDLYKQDAAGGPQKEFNLLRNDFENTLRSLNSKVNRVLVAELNMGLDNITLRDDLSPVMVLKTLLQV